MDDPDAKDYKWLVARERGEDIGHVPAGEREAYEQLSALIGSGLAPRAGFRQRVLDLIDAEERGERPAPESEQLELDEMMVRAAAPVVAPVPLAEPVAQGAEVIPIRPKRPTEPAPMTTAVPARPFEPGAVEAPVVPIRKRPSWHWIAAGGLAAAAAAAVVLFATSPRRGAEPSAVLPRRGAAPAPLLAVNSEVRAGPTVLRADAGTGQANVGDRLVVRARVHGSGEVRVYGGSNERLLASCKHPGDCTLAGEGEHRSLVLEVELMAPGPVRTVVFAGERIPVSAGSYGPDLEAAERASVPYEIDKRVWDVR
jgi:hypothetical protein